MTLNVRSLEFASLLEDIKSVIIEGTDEGWDYNEIVQEISLLLREYEAVES